MKKLNTRKLKKMMENAAKLIVANEPYLTEIDHVIGDGDHGLGMKRGFSALYRMLEKQEFHEVDSLCKAVGMELVKSMGGASGVIFGTMFIGGIHELPHESCCNLIQLARYFEEGEKAIERRGKAKAGQKTMLDALIPAVESLNHSAAQDEEMETAFLRAYYAALDGVKASKGMESKIGRSKNFREATIGLPDPGAVSTSLLFKAFYEEIIKE